MATSNSTLEIKIKTTGASKARKGVSGIGKASKKAKKEVLSLNKAANKLKKGWLGIAVATAGTVAILKKSIQLHSTQLKAETALTNALRINAKASEYSTASWKKYASALQDITIIGDEVSLKQIALAKTMGLSDTMTKQLVTTSQDMATAIGVDGATAFRILSQSLSGQLGTMKRYMPLMPEFTAEQLELGKAIKWVSEQTLGQAKALASTPWGKTQQAVNSFGDVLEGVGKALLGVADASGLLDATTKNLGDLSKLLGALNENTPIASLSKDVQELNNTLETTFNIAKAVASILLLRGAGKFLSKKVSAPLEKQRAETLKRFARGGDTKIPGFLKPTQTQNPWLSKSKRNLELSTKPLINLAAKQGKNIGTALGAGIGAGFLDEFFPGVEGVREVLEKLGKLADPATFGITIKKPEGNKLNKILDATFTKSDLFNRSKDNAVNVPEVQAPMATDLAIAEELKLAEKQMNFITKASSGLASATAKLNKEQTLQASIAKAYALSAGKILSLHKDSTITTKQYSNAIQDLGLEAHKALQSFQDSKLEKELLSVTGGWNLATGKRIKTLTLLEKVHAKWLRSLAKENALFAIGKTNEGEKSSAIAKWTTEYENAVSAIEGAKLDAKMEKIAESMEDSITDAIMKISEGLAGFKELAGSIFRSIATEMVRAKISKPIASFASSLLGDVFGKFLGAPSANNAMLSSSGYSGGPLQARAKGGPVSAGSTYLVGEEGVELFIPNMNGNIVSHANLVGETVSDIQNFRRPGNEDKELKKFTVGDEFTLLEDFRIKFPDGNPWYAAMEAILGTGSINGKKVNGVVGWNTDLWDKAEIGDIVWRDFYKAEGRNLAVGNIDNITQKIRDLVARGNYFYEILATNFMGKGNNAFANFVLPPEPKEPAKNIFGALGAGFLAATISQMYKSLKSPLISLGGDFGNAASSITPGGFTMIPGRANGGTVSSNSPYIVGEQGPELFIPNRTGSIAPNGTNISGGDTIVNVSYSPQVNALDPRTATTVIAQNASTIVGIVRQAFNRSGQAVSI